MLSKKKNALKKFLVIGCMIAILAACSNSQKKSNETATPESSMAPTETAQSGESPSPEATAASKDEALSKYEEPVTISKMGVTSPSIKYIEGESIDDNVITKLYKEKLNIVYTSKVTVEQSKAKEKLNLMIASNEMPDTFEVDIDQLKKLIEADQIEDLTGVYEKYASDNLKKTLEYQNAMGFVPAKKDGKIMALPIVNDYANNIAIMYIRQDWLDRLHLKAPTTIDELKAVAKAFVEQDPDQNQKADTYAIALANNVQNMNTLGTLGSTLDGISAALNAYPKIWKKDAAGKLVYGSVQPEMKEALGIMNELHKMNAFDKEFAVKDDGKVAETVAAGKVGIFFGPFWQPIWPLALNLDNDKKAQWNAYEIPANKDGVITPKALPFTYSWQVVRKGFAHPEAVVKSMNLWYEVFHGSLSGWWNDLLNEKYKSIENAHLYALPVFFAEADKNLKLGKNFQDAVKANNRDLLTTGEGKMKWDAWKTGSTAGWAFHKYLTESEDVLSRYKQYQFDEFLGAPTPTMVSKKATLDKLEAETFVKIIMGAAPLSEFDAFASKWSKLGGDSITNEVNAWYETTK